MTNYEQFAIITIMVKESDRTPNPFHKPANRHEAGEGWFFEVPDRRLLGAIVAREIIAQEIGEVRGEERAQVLQDFREQADLVERIKAELGLGEAPPFVEPDD